VSEVAQFSLSVDTGLRLIAGPPVKTRRVNCHRGLACSCSWADKGRWSIWVNGNWRLTFAFRDGHVFDLDFEDYH